MYTYVSNCSKNKPYAINMKETSSGKNHETFLCALGVRVLSDLDVSIDSILLSMETFCKATEKHCFFAFCLEIERSA